MTSESSGEQAYGHGMQRTCVWLFVWFDVLRLSQQIWSCRDVLFILPPTKTLTLKPTLRILHTKNILSPHPSWRRGRRHKNYMNNSKQTN